MDIRATTAQAWCRAVMEHPDAPDYSRRLAERVLQQWQNDTTDREPILIYAGYRYEDGNTLLLSLVMSDEDFNITSFTVEETRVQSNGEEQILRETYPVFVHNRIGHHQLVHPRVRANAAQAKDEQAWSQFAENPPDSWTDHPTIFLSPDAAVQIRVTDKNGNRSNIVPLEEGLLLREKGQRRG